MQPVNKESMSEGPGVSLASRLLGRLANSGDSGLHDAGMAVLGVNPVSGQHVRRFGWL
jgi:hypothetical protein